jgi:hypothetical protein
MSEAIWIAIISSSVAILVSLGIAYWQIRAMRSLADPTKYQLSPKTKSLIRLLGKIVISLLLVGIASSLSIYVLITEALNPTPPTRRTIIYIAIHVGIITFNFMSVLGTIWSAIFDEIENRK